MTGDADRAATEGGPYSPGGAALRGGPRHGLMLCDDLIFFSRVAATARAAGLSVWQVRTAAALLEQARRDPPGGVIFDLHAEGLDVPALLAGLRAACPVMPRTVAFGSHVEADLLKAARQAGCDRVMPRSQFVKELEGGLAEWLTPVTAPPGG